jgi:hypothetical protein
LGFPTGWSFTTHQVVLEKGGDVELTIALSPQGRKKKEMALP